MTSQNKLIKQGIKYTDAVFDEISKRLEQGIKSSDTLEAFLEKYHNAFPDADSNPVIALGYDKRMLDLILQETNNHKFSRPAQKELVRVTVESRVGENIRDVGENIRADVRDIVKHGYDNGLSQDEIAANISSKVNGIKNKRARAIARTEIARTATISDYIINKERGATHFYVECRNTACPVCKEAWHKHWSKASDESFTPKDSSAGGKGWIGDRTYSMKDTAMLPPIHPNCYDSETKVFTDNGWKYFKDVTETDKFLSLNPMTNETEFLEPVKLIEVPNVHGKLYHIHNKWFDVCVTPDHDCFIHQRRDGGNRGKYLEPQFRKPSELSSESRFVRCIDTDRENPKTVNVNGLEFTPEDYAFFMAWYISEGSVLHNPETAKKHAYPVKITQEIDANREIIEPKLKAICDKLGYRLAIGKSYYEIYSKQLYDYLAPLGYSHEKYIPSEMFTLNKECLNIFLDNYVLGDGHERTESNSLVSNGNERILFTSSKRLRDDLSYLILLCGYYPSIGMHAKAGTVSNHSNGKYVQNHDVYRISINKSKYTTFSSCTVDEIDYSDLVYCVELPKYHTLWVMRNGKTSWNGNCRCVPYFISEDDVDGPVEPVRLTKPTTETTTETIEETYKSLIPPKVTKKLDNFGNEYGASSKEHMQFFTENSQSSASHGSKGTVSKNGDQLNFMKNETSKGNVVHGTHNHPNDHEHYTMLSHEDVVDIFMGLNSDGIDLGSFSAENNRNRISVVKLPNYGEYTRYSEISGVKVDLRMTVNGVFSTYVDEYHKMRGTSSGGRLAYLREKRREIKEKYPDIKSYELFEKMEKYEKEADKIDWEKDHRKKIDETYKEMIMKVNEEVEPFGIRFEVKYKN